MLQSAQTLFSRVRFEIPYWQSVLQLQECQRGSIAPENARKCQNATHSRTPSGSRSEGKSVNSTCPILTLDQSERRLPRSSKRSGCVPRPGRQQRPTEESDEKRTPIRDAVPNRGVHTRLEHASASFIQPTRSHTHQSSRPDRVRMQNLGIEPDHSFIIAKIRNTPSAAPSVSTLLMELTTIINRCRIRKRFVAVQTLAYFPRKAKTFVVAFLRVNPPLSTRRV